MKHSLRQLIEMAYEYIPRNYAPSDKFVLIKAKGCWMWDTEGKKYLDMLACYSANNFGSGNDEIIRATVKQLERGLLSNANCFWEINKILFSKELAEFCGMDKALIMNSGAEAVETAMKIARKWAYVKKRIGLNKAEIIFCENNFHGRTLGVISASTTPQYTKYFGPLLPGIVKIPFGDSAALGKAINKNTAAFIFEPIQGEGGIIIPPNGYLGDVREICTRRNVIMIADEIQSGFGRTGKMFACEHEGVKPDMMIVGKALGGGVRAVSAVVGKKQFMDVFIPGDHGSTFGGNPIGCAEGLAALRFTRENHPEINATIMGTRFFNRLYEIQKKSRGRIIEIRGRGLWVGLEVNHKGPTAHEYCERLYDAGVLCKETRDYTIRFSPPLTITKRELDWGLERIEKIFTK